MLAILVLVSYKPVPYKKTCNTVSDVCLCAAIGALLQRYISKHSAINRLFKLHSIDFKTFSFYSIHITFNRLAANRGKTTISKIWKMEFWKGMMESFTWNHGIRNSQYGMVKYFTVLPIFMQNFLKCMQGLVSHMLQQKTRGVSPWLRVNTFWPIITPLRLLLNKRHLGPVKTNNFAKIVW